MLATTKNTSAVAAYTRLYACINTRKFKGPIPEKLHHCQISKKWFTWHVISIAEIHRMLIQSTQTRPTFYLSIVRCHLGYATQVWSPQSIGLLKRVEYVQRRAKKLILKLPFPCNVTCKTRVQLTNLLSISYWHEFLDIVFFYKAVDNLVFIDSDALPATRQSTRSTRSSGSNAVTHIPKRSRTVTYQHSFFIRASRACNVLPAELRFQAIEFGDRHVSEKL